MNIHIVLFYKFQKIEDPQYFAKKHLQFCKKLGVFGKVLVAHEGINGSISGTQEQIETYKKYVHSLKGFEDVWFKEEQGASHPFTKMFVRIKKEIIRIDTDVDMNKKGEYISPQELKKLYDSKEDFIIVDARNYYESHVGKFKNALTPELKTFREFPQFVNKFKKEIQDTNKKIVTYCTGGIRCEKASAYLKQEGFTNVYQLEGGIINFCQQIPDNKEWEGKCFVFDKRLMSDIDQNKKPITTCESCHTICDLYKNCKNPSCDKLSIICVPCQDKLQGCCSHKCCKEFNVYARERARLKKEGKWLPTIKIQNYVK